MGTVATILGDKLRRLPVTVAVGILTIAHYPSNNRSVFEREQAISKIGFMIPRQYQRAHRALNHDWIVAFTAGVTISSCFLLLESTGHLCPPRVVASWPIGLHDTTILKRFLVEIFYAFALPQF